MFIGLIISILIVHYPPSIVDSRAFSIIIDTNYLFVRAIIENVIMKVKGNKDRKIYTNKAMFSVRRVQTTSICFIPMERLSAK